MAAQFRKDSINMEENRILIVKTWIYDYEKREMLTIVPQIDDKEVLHLYANNYNWDNGYEIPELILENKNCDLSTALLIFYRADGLSYFMNRGGNNNLSKWNSFIKRVYDFILAGKYQSQEIEFRVPLSKVQVFKLKKILTNQENIFVENIEGKSLNIKL